MASVALANNFPPEL